MSNLVIFLAGLAFMLFLMIKTKYGPFVCMLIASLVIGLCCDLGTTGTINTIVNGFAATCKSLGLLVIFGTITGVGNTIAELLAKSPIPVILIPFLITGFSKFAQGSASVAGMLAAGLVLPLCNAGLLTPLDAFLSISAGAALGSHVNNSFTWVFSEFMGYDIKTTMRTLCVTQNLIMALSGLAAALLIHAIV